MLILEDDALPAPDMLTQLLDALGRLGPQSSDLLYLGMYRLEPDEPAAPGLVTFLPAMYLDHPRADLRARYPRRLRALAFDPPLVTQLPKESAGSDTEASPFADWQLLG